MSELLNEKGELLKDEKIIYLVKLRNPFNLKEMDKEDIAWSPDRTLAQYIPHVMGEYGVVQFVASLNGKIIEKELWDSTYLSPEDNIIICPIIGKGKQIFKLIAMVAIAVVAPQIGAALANSMGLAGATVMGVSASSILGTVVGFVGNMLVNSLLGNKHSNKQSDSLNASPTYGYDGPKNVSAEGIPVPVVYGTFRTGGNLINAYTENNGNSQYLYLLFAASEGEISGINTFLINDQPSDNFKDVVIDTRLGTENQPILEWFGDTVTPRSVNLKLSPTILTFNTLNVVDKIRFDVSLPGGLFQVNAKDGSLMKRTVEITIQYRKVGDTTWINLGNQGLIDHYDITYIVNGVEHATLPNGYQVGQSSTIGSGGMASINAYGYGSTVTNSNTIYKVETGFVFGAAKYTAVGTVKKTPVYKSVIAISGSSRTPIRQSFVTPLLPQGMYETRYFRAVAESTATEVSDSAYMSEINEIVVDDIQYNNTALVAMRILFSDQLNGLPKVTFLVNGRKIRVWDRVNSVWVNETSSNPAWVFLDMMSHVRYGGGLPDSRFNMEAIKDWALHCDTYNLTFNGVFDTSMTSWDAIQYVLRCGHAQILTIGTIITIAIERAQSAVMMFSVANMVEGSFKIDWLPRSERANEIDVSYFDALDGYKQTTIKVIDQSAIDNNVPIKTASITLFGVIDQRRAYNEGLLHLGMNREITQTATFDAALDAIACTVGDVIYVQHDMPQWGFAGRLELGSTVSSINLDAPMSMVTGKQYKLLCVFDVIQRASGSISNIIGTSLYLTGFSGSTSVKRIIVGTKDLEVLNVFDAGSGNYGVIVANTSGLSIGNAYTLHDTDVLEERDVINVGTGEYSSVTVTSPFTNAPAQYTQYMFGENTKVKKPFRVRSVTGSGEYVRTISAIEYNASIYNPDSTTILPTPNYSSLNSTPQNAVIAGATETLYKVGSGLGTKVTLNYKAEFDGYKTSKVLVSRNGGEFMLEGTDPYNMTILAQDGEELAFKVVAGNSVGIFVPESSSPIFNYTVLGKLAPPSNVTGFSSSVGLSENTLLWDKVDDIDLSYYEIRDGLNWDSGTVLVTNLSSTKFIDTRKAAGTYNYCIKAVDTSGIYSAVASTLTVTISAPLAPTVTASIVGADFKLSYTSPSSSFAIDHYEVRRGTSWASAAYVGSSVNNVFQSKIDFTGSGTLLVAAVDKGGNVGARGSVVLSVTAPPSTTISSQVSGSDVILNWFANAGSLPIAKYEVRYGATYATSTLITNTASTTFTESALWSGVSSRVYWVKTIDTAGNESAPASLTFNVTTLSAPSASAPVFTGRDVTFSWQKSTGTLPVDHYEVRGGGTSWATASFVASVSGTSLVIPASWGVGVKNFWIAAIDGANNTGAVTQLTPTITAPSTPTITSLFSGTNIVLNWTVASSLLPLDYYEVRSGGTSWATSTFITNTPATSFSETASWIGNKNYWVRAVDVYGNPGTPFNITPAITAPLQPTATAQIVDNNVLLYWNDTHQTLPISTYEIRKGAVYATAQVIGTKTGLFTTIFETTSGTFTYWVVAIDSAGNYGTPTSLGATVSQPPDYILKADYNSLLNSTMSSATKVSSKVVMPVNTVESFEKHFARSLIHAPERFDGAIWNKTNCTVTGNSIVSPDGTGNADTIVRTATGNHYVSQTYATTTNANKQFTFSVWLKSGTMTGNVMLRIRDGGAGEIAAVQATPTGTWTRFSATGTFGASPAANITVIIDPVNDTGVAGDTFYAYGAQLTEGATPAPYWFTLQDQISAGFPILIEPSASSGYYEEVIDYGTTFAACKVTISPVTENIAGAATITPTISLSLDNISWVDYVGVTQVFGTNFRYAKIRITAASSAGTDLTGLTALNVKLDVKLKNDAGSVSAVASDNSAAINSAAIGGTTVLFNVPFINITSITVTPQGTAPCFAIYDFIGNAVNPIGFKVYLYNQSGTRISGTVSWSAKGY